MSYGAYAGTVCVYVQGNNAYTMSIIDDTHFHAWKGGGGGGGRGEGGNFVQAQDVAVTQMALNLDLSAQLMLHTRFA
jgi:hypothetical protein